MELRQMRYFVAVAEELHFGRAAARLHISTPTLSQQVKAVEREVGAPLLVRRGRGVELTPAGATLLRTAREALRVAEEAVGETRRVAGVAGPVLRLGLLNGVPEWVPAWVEEVLAVRLPGCHVVMAGGTTSDQVRLLEGGEVDLALLRAPVELPAGLRQRVVAEEEIGVLMSAANPLAAQDAVGVADLAGRELILFARELAPGVHDAVLDALRSRGGDVVLSDSEVGHAQLRSVLPLRPEAVSLSSVRGAAPPGLVWRPLRGERLTMTYVAAWRPSSRNPALRAVVGELSRGLPSPPAPSDPRWLP